MTESHDNLGTTLRSAFGGNESLVMEVLGQIRDNMRRMGEEMSLTRNSVEDVKGRVIALEVRNQRLDAIEAKADSNSKRIDALEGVNDKKFGAKTFWQIVREYWTVIAGVLTVLWFAGRMFGLIRIPSDDPQTIIPHAVVHVTGATQ